MIRSIPFLICLFLIIGISASAQKITEKRLKEIFAEQSAEGTFVLYDLKKDKYTIHNKKRAEQEFLPASTFKIFNSLAALESGVVKDVDAVFEWDGTDKGGKNWNKDQSMREAFKNSTVWVYQEIARQVGTAQMKEMLTIAGYGNKSIDGGIDKFWLSGGLRITPMQQITFLKRLYHNNLPFSLSTMDKVKGIMIVENEPHEIIRAKTGWAVLPDQQYGWYVGWIEKAENVYFFVINMDIKKDEDAKKRKAIVKQVLKEMEI